MTKKKYHNKTELSKYIWDLKEKNQNFTMKWSIVEHAAAFA